jgi:hypothetical protein
LCGREGRLEFVIETKQRTTWGCSEITRVKHGITFLILCCFKYKGKKRKIANVSVLEKVSPTLLLLFLRGEIKRGSINGGITVMPALYVFSPARMSFLFLRFTPRNCHSNFLLTNPKIEEKDSQQKTFKKQTCLSDFSKRTGFCI